ncbi:E3 ubiquitin-protein ligase mind-bomb [Plakobranchus ocellatus]|uniref:E3 ubiquitin-protein ligase mind-bomb n=1 Tax=Plakobranchus ocellatus TaxID=259542 RepID=A0AAV4CBV3_9GAST|nr:E3 ubiquitin-protein ligase mind-bomb [Plakobranchus ocellatus]
MAAPFPLSDRASDVRPGCKTQRIAPTLRQVADLVCVRIKEREYFKTCIVGHVNCCLQCAPTLSVQGCKTQRKTPTLRQVADLVCARTKEREYFKTCIVGHVNCCLQCGPTLR